MPDIEKYDRLDQIKAHIYDGVEISPTQMQMLARYRACFTWMCENKSPTKAIQEAEREFGVSYPQAAKIVRDTIKVFGDVQNYSKEGMRQVMFERFLRLAELAEKAEDFRAAEKAYDKACKVLDLYNADVKALDIDKLFVFNSLLSTDPDVLRQQEERNTIDIQHDED